MLTLPMVSSPARRPGAWARLSQRVMRLNVGPWKGLAVVILAIFLDRVTTVRHGGTGRRLPPTKSGRWPASGPCSGWGSAVVPMRISFPGASA